ncbi:MAG: ABC transporter substrate-binding protein [Deltaproteobacteria bacterium]|nr:ABC transporter substrate-binding protein [Deltaproteobacteria bacterium]
MRTVAALLMTVLFLPLAKDAAGAQRQTQVPRIGFLGAARWSSDFLEGLRQLGYIEGKNIIVDYRFRKGTIEVLPELAADLVRLKVAIIVTGGPTATGAAMKATKTIPIVVVGGGDPVGRGFVESLSMPGGNVTGLSEFAKGLHGKRMELLKETFPSTSRVALINSRTRARYIETYQRAARSLGVNLETVDVHSLHEFERAFARITTMRPDALTTVSDTLTIRHAKQIGEFALKKRLPSIYDSRQFVTAGGLMSYGVNYKAQWRRAAFFVDKILKGANPASLPVEPPQFELVINLATARKIGRPIPPEILLEANEVIK